MTFLKQKISPILAFLFILVFGYFCLYVMNEVFERYAQDELMNQVAELRLELVQVRESLE